MRGALIILAGLVLSTAGAARASIVCASDDVALPTADSGRDGGSLAALGANAEVSVSTPTSAVRGWKDDQFPTTRLDPAAAIARMIAAGTEQEPGLSMAGQFTSDFNAAHAERASRLLGTMGEDQSMALSGAAGVEALRLNSQSRLDDAGATGRGAFNTVFSRSN